MTSEWTHEQLQRAIYREVAAVAYAETHEQPRSAVDAYETMPEPAPPAESGGPDVPTIVVGVDRSPASDTAVAWAAAEAVRRNGRLVLVRVEGLADLPLPTARWDEEERAMAVLAASVRQAHPSLEHVTGELRAGAAGQVLVARAADADLLVVGTHGRGAVSRAVLGSVSAYCAVHAIVPSVVVPESWSARHGQ